MVEHSENLAYNYNLLLPVLDNSQKDLDDAEPLGLLHSLYMMTFTPQGRDAVVHVFTMADNLQALLPFTELLGEAIVMTLSCTILIFSCTTLN